MPLQAVASVAAEEHDDEKESIETCRSSSRSLSTGCLGSSGRSTDLRRSRRFVLRSFLARRIISSFSAAAEAVGSSSTTGAWLASSSGFAVAASAVAVASGA